MHQQFLLQALELARQRLGYCAPNPAVGCVLVKDGAIIATGLHDSCGKPHAEVAALALAGEYARGATVYVTLEPCHHFGRTPPCTQALIQAGVKAIYYAVPDPNPLAQGGTQALSIAGISCQHVPVEAVSRFYQPYIHWITARIAQLTAKMALSLDGKYAIPGRKTVITGAVLAELTAKLRSQHDVIVTSIKTIINDDPRLNVRIDPQQVISKPVIVLDAHAKLPLTAQILKTAEYIIVLHNQAADPKRLAMLEAQGVRCQAIESSVWLKAKELPAVIGSLGFHTAWIETGTTWLASLIEARVLKQLYLYYGAQILGKEGLPVHLPNDELGAGHIAWHTLGNEVYCSITW